MSLFPLRIGDALIRRVEEQSLMVPPGYFLKPEDAVAAERATGQLAAHGTFGDPRSAVGKRVAEQVRAVQWLRPHYTDQRGNLRLVFQMYVIETPGGKRVAVDTCGGNDKRRDGLPSGHMQSRPFLDSMREAQVAPESVDFVLCTHLHWDHVGFNTVLRDGVWVPTFPNARYLFARREWAHFAELSAEKGAPEAEIMRDSVRPIADAGLHTLVDSDHVLIDEPGCRVRLTPTEGHTPGHVSVVVECAGHSAVITGDCIHHPVQMANPRLGTYFDSHSPDAADTRARLLSAAARERTLVVGTHFAQPSAGYVEPSGAGWRLRPLGDAATKL